MIVCFRHGRTQDHYRNKRIRQRFNISHFAQNNGSGSPNKKPTARMLQLWAEKYPWFSLLVRVRTISNFVEWVKKRVN